MTSAVTAGGSTGNMLSIDGLGVQAPGTPSQSVPQLWLQALVNEAGKLNAKDTGNGLQDANGAPVLTEPGTDFSGDGLVILLASLDSKCKEAQAKSAKNGIEATSKQRDAASAARIDKLKEALQRASEAASKSKSGKIWGWIAKVAEFVGAMVAVAAAAAATVVTGGAAAPLLVLAVLAAAGATVDLANQINQEVHPDAKPFTLGSLIGDAIIKSMNDSGLGGKGRAALSGMAASLGFVLMQPDLAGQMAEDSAVADGMSKEDAARLRMGVAIAAVVTTIIVMIAVTVASGGAASSELAAEASEVGEVEQVANGAQEGEQAAKTAQDAEQAEQAVNMAAEGQEADEAARAAQKAEQTAQMVSTANKVTKVAKYVQAGTSVVQGTAAIGSGVTNIEIAQDKKAADDARVQAKELEALLLKLQKTEEDEADRLKEVMAALDESWHMFSDMIASASDQRAHIARNIVHA